jgi:hypothetical protein
MQGEGGHISAENDLLSTLCIDEIRYSLVRFIYDGVRCDAGCELSGVIGIGIFQIINHTIKRWLSDLSAARVVEEDRLAI